MAKLAAGRPQDLLDAAKLKKALDLERKQLESSETTAELPSRKSGRKHRPQTKPDGGNDDVPVDS